VRSGAPSRSRGSPGLRRDRLGDGRPFKRQFALPNLDVNRVALDEGAVEHLAERVRDLRLQVLRSLDARTAAEPRLRFGAEAAGIA
jgi:hypothetical protein